MQRKPTHDVPQNVQGNKGHMRPNNWMQQYLSIKKVGTGNGDEWKVRWNSDCESKLIEQSPCDVFRWSIIRQRACYRAFVFAHSEQVKVLVKYVQLQVVQIKQGLTLVAVSYLYVDWYETKWALVIRSPGACFVTLYNISEIDEHEKKIYIILAQLTKRKVESKFLHGAMTEFRTYWMHVYFQRSLAVVLHKKLKYFMGKASCFCVKCEDSSFVKP